MRYVTVQCKGIENFNMLFLSLAFPLFIMVSDIQPSAGDEKGCIFQVCFGAPEFLLHCLVLWPVLDSCSLVGRAGLQDVLWGL